MSAFLLNSYRFNDPVTAEFAALHTAAGSTLTSETLAAVDAFVKTGRAAGWWDRLLEIYPFVGSSLAGALIKLKTATGLSTSMTNVGMQAGDYNQAGGIGPSALAARHMTTGFFPASHGMTLTNMCIGGSLIWTTVGSDGWAFSSQSSSGESIATVNNNGATVGHMGGAQYRAQVSVRHIHPRILQTSYGDGTTYPRFTEHMMGGRTWSTNNSFTLTGGGLATEMMFFRSRRFGTTTYYNADKVGLHYIGLALTAEQGESLGRAIRVFERAIGRTVYQGNEIGIVGDSIASGQNATTIGNTWVGLLQANRGGLMVNTARPSLAFNTTSASAGRVIDGVTSFQALGLSKWIVSIGTNDINTDPVANGDAARIASYKAAMITFLTALVAGGASASNILVTSPHYIRPAQASLTKCRAYAVAVSEAAAAVGCSFADIDQHFRNGGGDAWMNDNTHPNNTGHAEDFAVINAALP